MTGIEDLSGRTFGRLTVLRFAKIQKSRTFWLCRCECGVEKDVDAKLLKRGSTKSCGCLARELASVRKYGRKPHGVAAQNDLFRSYKDGAKKRNYEFALTLDEFLDITGRNCSYCGVEPRQLVRLQVSNGNYVHNGIDRVDNNKGYTVDNCVSCCGTCNAMKMAMSVDEFVVHIKRILSHLEGERK